jgi:hypothetical protein
MNRVERTKEYVHLGFWLFGRCVGRDVLRTSVTSAYSSTIDSSGVLADRGPIQKMGSFVDSFNRDALVDSSPWLDYRLLHSSVDPCRSSCSSRFSIIHHTNSSKSVPSNLLYRERVEALEKNRRQRILQY